MLRTHDDGIVPNLVLCFGQGGGNGVEKTVCGEGGLTSPMFERYEPAYPSPSDYPVNRHDAFESVRRLGALLHAGRESGTSSWR